MKIRQVESELSQADLQTDRQADRQTDRDEVNIRFSQFCEGALNPLRFILGAHVYVGCR
jgi:hypothetical protein